MNVVGDDRIEPSEGLEETDCPLCEGSTSRVAYCWPYPSCYRVVRCESCGFYFLSPRPTEAAMLSVYQHNGYYDDAWKDGYEDYSRQETALRLTFRRLMKTLNRQGLTGGSLLEVGCGFGFLLDEARPWFNSRHGSDFSPKAVALAGPRADRVFLGGVAAISPELRYDVIIANQVIEHVYQPADFVRALKERLNPGGVLVLATPHMGSLWRVLMGRRWPSFKLPEHVLYFDEDHLGTLMKDCGFSTIKTIPYAHAFPLALVLSKLGLRLKGRLGQMSLWLPGTTLAMWGRADGGMT